MFQYMPCSVVSVIAVICAFFGSMRMRRVYLDMLAGLLFVLGFGAMARAYAFSQKGLKGAE